MQAKRSRAVRLVSRCALSDRHASRESAEPIHGMRGDPREHISKPGERLDCVSLAYGNEAQQHGRRLAAIVAAEKCPVAAAESDVSAGPLSGPIVDFQIAVFEKA